MILIFADELDDIAQATVAEWPAANAQLLTVSDLANQGWFVDHTNFSQSTLVCNGQSISIAEITGLIITKPYIFAAELYRIESASRLYVAGELGAFLFYVFNALTCPRINCPSPYNLASPNYRYEQWQLWCLALSIPFKVAIEQPIVEPQTVLIPTKVIVLAGRVIAGEDPAQQEAALQLAAIANIIYLEVLFIEIAQQSYFYAANPIPDLSQPAVCSALQGYFKD